MEEGPHSPEQNEEDTKHTPWCICCKHLAQQKTQLRENIAEAVTIGGHALHKNKVRETHQTSICTVGV